MTDEDLISKAMNEFKAGRAPMTTPAPFEAVEIAGRVFVVLRDGYKTRAVYERQDNNLEVFSPRMPGEYPKQLDLQ